MHDQTRAELLGHAARSRIGAAREMVKGWPPLRLALIAIIILWLGGMVFWKLVSRTNDQDLESLELNKVLVTHEYIPAYSAVKKSMVSLKNFPRQSMPPGALHSLNELTTDMGHWVYTTAVALPAGHPLTSAVLIDLRKNDGMSASLPSGKIAVSIAVDKVRGAGGWVQPGDHVAIYLTSRSMENRFPSSPSSRLLFPAASVIAVDKSRLGQTHLQTDSRNGLLDSGDSMEGGGSVITLAMNLIDATTLIQAEEQGHLKVAIRALGDELEEERHGK